MLLVDDYFCIFDLFLPKDGFCYIKFLRIDFSLLQNRVKYNSLVFSISCCNIHTLYYMLYVTRRLENC